MELIPLSQQQIEDQTEPTVDARKLHAFLGVRRRFSAWIRDRIEQYGFKENQDFVVVRETGGMSEEVFPKIGKNSKGGRPKDEYFLCLDMAKELAMVERTEKGREARRYFIACERRLQEHQRARLEVA